MQASILLLANLTARVITFHTISILHSPNAFGNVGNPGTGMLLAGLSLRSSTPNGPHVSLATLRARNGHCWAPNIGSYNK
jgi:hypothetical protein